MMKLWEVIKELTENKEKTFMLETDGRIFTLSVDRNGYFHLDCNYKGENINDRRNGGFSGNIEAYANWQLVRQPVAWQEAIQAWADGKKVSYKYSYNEMMYAFQDSNRMLCIEKIKDAIWYIED